MARALRIEYPGAVYHVMCRGNDGRDIYHTEQDRSLFLHTLGEVVGQSGWRVHSYVLMRNHYHLLLETPEPNLVAGMKWFQGTYTQRHHAVHRRRGHLFQGRYKSLLVDSEEPRYFRVVSDYIHLNPARAKLCGTEKKPLGCYEWSSYPQFLWSKKKRPEWLWTERVLHAHGYSGDDARSRRTYAEYLEGRAREARLGRGAVAEDRRIRRGWILGSSQFRDRMLDLLGRGDLRSADNYRGEQRQMHGQRQAERCIAAVLGETGMTEAGLLSLNSTRIEKQAVAWILKRNTVVTGQWIAERLQMGHRVNASRAIHQFAANTTRQAKTLKKTMLQCTG